MNRKMSTRCSDIRENAGRAAEHIVLDLHPFVYGHIVLNADAIANADIVGHIHILSQGTMSTYHCATLDMAEMPYLRAFTDGGTLIDIR